MKQIQEKLAEVNARRRVRYLTEVDVARAISSARESGFAVVTGGLVSGSYKYPATTACVAAVKVPGGFALLFGSTDAHETSSQVTWLGIRSCRPSHVKAWRENFIKSEHSEEGAVYISSRAAYAFTKKITCEEIPAHLRDVLLTKDASLGAGNCADKTNHVAEAFKNKPTPTWKVVERFPSLKGYIIRAAQYAYNAAHPNPQ
jgi:hypothetical protein